MDVGSDVTGIAVGDRVATSTPHCSVFLVPADECIVVPDSVTNEQACWASLACTTQLGVRRAELSLGESAAVVGLGALGQLVVQYLRLSGARHIIAIEPGQSRSSLARSGGATEVISADVGTALDEVRDITGGAMVDVAFDITGHPDVLAPTTRLVHQLGRVILLGDTPTPSRQQLGPRIVADSVSVLGVHASAAPEVASLRDPWTLPAMTSLFFDWVSSGQMDVDSLVTHRFQPDQAVEVYEALTGGQVGVSRSDSRLEGGVGMTPIEPLRWGVLGTAGITERVIPAMARSEYAEIVAIASRTTERADEAARALGIPSTYSSYAELLTDPDIDAVYIPLPNFLHLEWVLAAAGAGKHILCEKPMAITAADARTDGRRRCGLPTSSSSRPSCTAITPDMTGCTRSSLLARSARSGPSPEPSPSMRAMSSTPLPSPDIQAAALSTTSAAT